MARQKLQRHRKAAFLKTLDVLESSLESKIKFITFYNDVYKFPAAIARTNLRNYKRQLKAVQQLKDI